VAEPGRGAHVAGREAGRDLLGVIAKAAGAGQLALAVGRNGWWHPHQDDLLRLEFAPLLLVSLGATLLSRNGANRDGPGAPAPGSSGPPLQRGWARWYALAELLDQVADVLIAPSGRSALRPAGPRVSR
jgi:hypothetical protein